MPIAWSNPQVTRFSLKETCADKPPFNDALGIKTCSGLWAFTWNTRRQRNNYHSSSSHGEYRRTNHVQIRGARKINKTSLCFHTYVM